MKACQRGWQVLVNGRWRLGDPQLAGLERRGVRLTLQRRKFERGGRHEASGEKGRKFLNLFGEISVQRVDLLFTVQNVLRAVERGQSSNLALAGAGVARCRRGLPSLGNGVLTCDDLTGFNGRVQ